MLCTIKVNSNSIELTMRTSCYCVLGFVLVIKCNYNLTNVLNEGLFQNVNLRVAPSLARKIRANCFNMT